jgi:3-hydroxyisobutyrate dehydrogenase-like beta-hydroxyacid dehydrogenase
VSVGLVGLGLMGSAMAPRLTAAGGTVVGCDIDEARRVEHLSRGGEIAASPKQVAARCDVVVLSLPTSEVAREVCLGPGSIVEAERPVLVIDTTTPRPSDTVAIGNGLAEHGIRYVDATLSGNADMARRGDLVAMVGGTDADVAAAGPTLDAIARSVHHLGPLGSGAQTKLIVNLVLGVHRAALAEALVMGERAGLDLDVLLDVLQDGAAYSKAMDIAGRRMVEADHYPPASRIRQSHKDFRLIDELGQDLEAPIALASVVRHLLEQGEGEGLGDADNSAVVEVVRRRANIGRVER